MHIILACLGTHARDFGHGNTVQARNRPDRQNISGEVYAGYRSLSQLDTLGGNEGVFLQKLNSWYEVPGNLALPCLALSCHTSSCVTSTPTKVHDATIWLGATRIPSTVVRPQPSLVTGGSIMHERRPTSAQSNTPPHALGQGREQIMVPSSVTWHIGSLVASPNMGAASWCSHGGGINYPHQRSLAQPGSSMGRSAHLRRLLIT